MNFSMDSTRINNFVPPGRTSKPLYKPIQGINTTQTQGTQENTETTTPQPTDTTLTPEQLKKARVDSLIKAQDKARNSKRLQARDGKTFCNEGVKMTLKQLGMPLQEAGITHKKGYAYTANTMAKNMSESAQEENGYWLEVDPKRAQELANDGIVVVGAQSRKGHGHVVTVRPGYDPSENPMINNVGTNNKVKRANYAFDRDLPVHYYAPRTDANSIK
ncbi:MAG: hypothetical protein BWY64_01560 [bacterium ADurb.Bin363]|nr:MAG: hypothetical protein BWY64_01560 [bacterium ADurb.Bin363]